MHTRPYIIIDLETLSEEPNAAIFAIAAMDQDAQGFALPVNLAAQPDAHRDDATIMWWIERGAPWIKAMKAHEGQQQAFPETIPLLLDDLYNDGHVWVRRPQFDIPILKHCCGTYLNETPWDYTAIRDVATAADLVGYDKPKNAHDPWQDCLAAKATIDKFYQICDERNK